MGDTERQRRDSEESEKWTSKTRSDFPHCSAEYSAFFSQILRLSSQQSFSPAAICSSFVCLYVFIFWCDHALHQTSMSPKLVVETDRASELVYFAFNRCAFSRQLLFKIGSTSTLSLERQVDEFTQAFNTNDALALIDLSVFEGSTKNTLLMCIIRLLANILDDKINTLHSSVRTPFQQSS